MQNTPSPAATAPRTRPRFPRRAVVTAGMPYGNKDLHFGHVGGMFVHADAYARFLRDRIGRDNVLFVSGTDCYGSPIVADYATRKDAGWSGSLEDFVRGNHERQRETLERYAIGLDRFGASALDPDRAIHAELGAWILKTLHRRGRLTRRAGLQFYDPVRETFLNGRQVVGRCPIEGCRSEKAYADECSLGHQYEPSQLIAPRSTLTGGPPEMREVTNWYLDVEPFRERLSAWLAERRERGDWREHSVGTVLEYFAPPAIAVKRESLDEVAGLEDALPAHRREPGAGPSDRLVFGSLEERERAAAWLTAHGCRFRTGKTLVPFRLTGNLEWGLPAPDLEGLGGLTFWVWPESLWAPISFTSALLEGRGRPKTDWTEWWCSDDAEIYQFIGEDNLYFYGLAEPALFLGLREDPDGGAEARGDGSLGRDGARGEESSDDDDFAGGAVEERIRLPRIVANRHILFGNKKASSSGAVKPPLAHELLEHYTADQLRIHFLSLGLSKRNASFRPKALDPAARPEAGDPVLKHGGVLSNAFNHAVRSCFYTAQKYYDRRLPDGEVGEEITGLSERVILDYEDAMARYELHTAVETAAAYVAEINTRWSRSRPFREECDPDVRRQALIDAFHMVRVAVVLMHPIAPIGTERIRAQLAVGEELWDWNRIFEPLSRLLPDPAEHRFPHLPPRSDFFEKKLAQVGDARG